jgi:hypothetical protein
MNAGKGPSLESEIAAARLEISADTISMSVTELTSLYKEGTLIIRPEFQRLYRWSNEQKSRLIESVLLGIPLPSLFVSQSESGTWELVDGLQRVSTLLELQGVLATQDGGIAPELILDGTKFLPRLEHHTWSGRDDTVSLTEAQKLDIRLARLDIKVIKRSSDPKAKFDLFQRLNSFGSVLTGQEIRSAMIAGTNSAALAWLTRLAQNDDFLTCVALNDRLIDEQYDLELVLRFLMLHNRKIEGRSGLTDFPARLNDWSVEFAGGLNKDDEQLRRIFEETFASLANHGGERILKKWDPSRGDFRGGFSNTSFEVFALGLGYCVANGIPHREDYLELAQRLWTSPDMIDRFATGLATADRFIKTIPLGRQLLELK